MYALGIITTRFPTVGEVMSPSCPQISCAGSTDETDIDPHRCGCPRRQKPPPVPTKLPFDAHGKTDQNSRNIYWTTTHRARSTPANISCMDHHSDSWSTLMPAQWPTTRQSLCIGRRKSKPGWTAMCDSV